MWVITTTGGTIKQEEAVYVDSTITIIGDSKGIKFKGLPKENNDDGKYYEVISARYIRTEASMNGRIKKVKECTAAMQKALTSTNPNANAQIKAGKTITSIGVTKKSNGRKWIKNYSDYVCLEGKAGDIFLKKVC